MGKASSAKKVARAARTGGARKRDRPKLAFPLAIFVVIVAGALLVTQARFTHETDAQAETAPSYTKKDHWHAAYGLYVCDHFLPPLNDVKDDKTGIHTHGEGIIHIHPFTAAASGLKAQLHIFADQIGLTLGDDGFKTPDGTEYHNGFDCKGKPGKFAVYKFKVDDPTATVEVFEKDINKINFTEDRDAYTIAILPEGAAEPPPMPDSVAELDRLSDVDQSSTGAGAGAGQDPSVSIPTGIDPSLSVPDLSTPTASTPTVSDPTASTPTVSDPTASVSTPPTPAPSTP
jgi:hypothetical protein